MKTSRLGHAGIVAHWKNAEAGVPENTNAAPKDGERAAYFQQRKETMNVYFR